MTASPEGTVSALGGHTSPVADAPRSHTLSPEVEIHHPSGASDTASTRLHVPVSDCDLHGSAVMNEEIVMQAFDNFFRHLRPIPAFSFLHKASLLQRYQAGLVDRSMILAVIGIVTAMTDFPAVSKECGARCIQEAERLVISDFGSPSVLKTQVLVLIIKYYAWQREHSKSFMLLATASRFAYAMKLNYEAPDLSFVAQESRRRLMWSIYVLDTIFGSGVRELTLCPDETLLIQLPCHERNFDFDLPQVTEPLKLMSHQPLSDNVGFVGLYVRIMNLRSKILRATKNAVVSQNHEQVPALVEGLKSELDTFMARVPASLHFSSKSLHLHAHSSDLCPFLLVHLWWRQCYCDLYRVTLRGLREALPCAALDQLGPEFVIYCQFQCFEAAKALSAVFRSSLALKVTLPVMGSEIYACAYQCQEDVQKLISRGASTGSSPSRPSTPERTRGYPNSSLGKPVPTAAHILSRHSIVRQLDIVDDSAALGMPRFSDGDETPSQYAKGYEDTASRPEPASASSGVTFSLTEGTSNDLTSLATSNPFQGAFDGLDLDLDPHTLDPFTWNWSPWDSSQEVSI
ncbi:hypothetical protein LTS17_005068 [Exophiala oligosperma]